MKSEDHRIAHEYVGMPGLDACVVRVGCGTPKLGNVYERSCNWPACLHKPGDSGRVAELIRRVSN